MNNESTHSFLLPFTLSHSMRVCHLITLDNCNNAKIIHEALYFLLVFYCCLLNQKSFQQSEYLIKFIVDDDWYNVPR